MRPQKDKGQPVLGLPSLWRNTMNRLAIFLICLMLPSAIYSADWIPGAYFGESFHPFRFKVSTYRSEATLVFVMM